MIILRVNCSISLEQQLNRTPVYRCSSGSIGDVAGCKRRGNLNNFALVLKHIAKKSFKQKGLETFFICHKPTVYKSSDFPDVCFELSYWKFFSRVMCTCSIGSKCLKNQTTFQDMPGQAQEVFSFALAGFLRASSICACISGHNSVHTMGHSDFGWATRIHFKACRIQDSTK